MKDIEITTGDGEILLFKYDPSTNKYKCVHDGTELEASRQTLDMLMRQKRK